MELQTPAPPPENTIDLVKQALESLFDFPALQKHPLTARLQSDSGGDPGAQRLRRLLLASIESLSPGPQAGFRAPGSRIYNLLHLRYVEGRTVQEAAHDLGISLRQAHRDLRRGEESVAALLAERMTPVVPAIVEEKRGAHLSTAELEMSRLEIRPAPADLAAIFQKALGSVRPLSLQRGIALDCTLPTEPVPVSTDPSIAQQTITSLLSRAIQNCSGGTLAVVLEVRPDAATLCLRRDSTEGLDRFRSDAEAAVKLAARLGWEVAFPEAGAPAETRLIVPLVLPTLLVVDDNQGLVDLISRLLAGHACRVISANNGDDGLRLADQARPDAILLDVMMPGRDGWEVLQVLRNRPGTAAIPVIVCSALNDPELAYSLGASNFLPKQVGRESLLDALHKLGLV